MYIKMDRYGRYIQPLNSLPYSAKYVGDYVYVDDYYSLYLEVSGDADEYASRNYDGDIIRIGNVYISYDTGRRAIEIAGVRIYHLSNGLIYELNGLKINYYDDGTIYQIGGQRI